MADIKAEPFEAGENVKVKHEVKEEEEAKVLASFASEQEEIEFWISQRGKTTSSRVGRKAGAAVASKEPALLSQTASAIAQRSRAETLSAEQKALQDAGNSDRNARHHALRNLRSSPEYTALSDDMKKSREDELVEQINQKRWDGKQSREWMESQLLEVHRKWAAINKSATIAAINAATTPVKAAKAATTAPPALSSAQGAGPARWIFGSGRVYEKWVRKSFEEAKAAVRAASGTSKEPAALLELQNFMNQLTDDEKLMLENEAWTETEPQPLPVDLTGAEGGRAFIHFGDNECEVEYSDSEEEAEDADDELEEMFDDDAKEVVANDARMAVGGDDEEWEDEE